MARNYQVWKNKDVEFLKENFPLHGSGFCAKELDTSISRVRLKVQSLGLKMNKSSLSFLRHKQNKVAVENLPVDPYPIMKASNPRAAYWLGLFWADGYIDTHGRSKRIGFCMKSTDARSLMPIFNNLGTWSYSEYMPKKRSTSMQSRIRTSNPILVDYLISIGASCKSYKSANSILNTIDPKLQSFWWRGYFDGDGCISFNTKNKHHPRITFSSSYSQNWSFVKDLFLKWRYDPPVYRTKTTTGKSSKCGCYKKSVINKFYNYVYQDNCEMGLLRKQEKFKTLFNE